METQLWAIALKTEEDSFKLKSQLAELATVNDFKVPADDLRVGTLDSLMSLSDDLAKLDVLAEATTMKIYRQLFDLKGEEPTITGGEQQSIRTHIGCWPRCAIACPTRTSCYWPHPLSTPDGTLLTDPPP